MRMHSSLFNHSVRWPGMKKAKGDFTNQRGGSKQNPTEAEEEFLDKFPLEVLEAVLNILRARSRGKHTGFVGSGGVAGLVPGN